MKKRKLMFGLVLVFMLVVAPLKLFASVTIAWDQTTTNADGSPLTDLAGYKIYYDTDVSGAPYNGTGLTESGSPVTVPLSSLTDVSNPDFVLSGLTTDITYYITITAYDTSNNESGYSNEINVVESTPPILVEYYCDGDGDGYVSNSVSGSCDTSNCMPVGCQTTPGDDYDDNNVNVNPGANDDNCNGIDENCDGIADDGYISTATSCGFGVCASIGQLLCQSGTEVDTCPEENVCNSSYVGHIVIPDLNANSSEEIVALRSDPVTGKPTIVLVDIGTGKIINQEGYFHSNTLPKKLVSLGDLDGSGAPEILVLVYDYDINQNDYEIRDALTGNLFTGNQSVAVDTPTGFIVQIVAETQIGFSWDTIAGAEKYLVYRDGVLIGETTTAGYIDDTVSAAICYIYTVETVSGNIRSNLSLGFSIATTGGTCSGSGTITQARHIYYTDATGLKLATVGTSNGKVYVYIINMDTGALEHENQYFTSTSNYTALTLISHKIGNEILISVLAINETDGKRETETRYTDGTLF